MSETERSSPPASRLVVALRAEARPLIERLRLRPDADAEGFAVYRRDHLALAISGVGKVAAAAAAGYLHAKTGSVRHAVWLNVGVAGHAELAVGTLRLAHTVRDEARGVAWYPPQLATPAPTAGALLTVGAAAAAPPPPWLVDMEASGFMAAAGRFASAELVHCLKVVSDHGAAASDALPADRVARLIAEHLDAVVAYLDALGTLSSTLRRLEAAPAGFEALCARFRFTVSERRTLRRLLTRRRALLPDPPLDGLDLAGCRAGGDVNRRLAAWLDALPVTIGSGS